MKAALRSRQRKYSNRTSKECVKVLRKVVKKFLSGKGFLKYLVTGVMFWSSHGNLANAGTLVQCYAKYQDRYSLYDSTFRERYLYDNKPFIRLTISDAEVLSFENYSLCGYGSDRDGRVYGWVDTVTPSKISLFCEDIKWEPEKRSGIKRTLDIDRYNGEIVIEEFGYSPNNDDMAYPFTMSILYGSCELASPKF